MLAERLARLSRRQRLVLVGMLLSIALVVTGATALVVASPTRGGATGATTHPSAVTSHPLVLSALPDPTVTPATPGTWATTLTFAQGVAFAPSAPTAMFACGSQNGMLALALSRDGGQTWKAYRTSVAATNCAMSVAPTNPKDVALVVQPCQGACQANAPAALYRSSDGGQTWLQALLPNGDGFALTLGWAGLDLYATTNDAAHPLAVSVGGADFALRDDIGRFSGQIDYLGASGGVMYAELQPFAPVASTPTSTTPGAPSIVQTTNGGLAWSLTTLSDPPFTPTFVRASADGSAILALEGSATLVVSRNGGGSWQSAADFPSGMTLAATRFVARAPDGTLSALLQDTANALTLATLAPGADTWQALATLPAGARLLVFSWNAAGHPEALWATANGHLLSNHF